LFIENSDFVFIDRESNSARVEFEALVAKVAFELLFFGDLVSEIAFLVDSKGVIEVVEFKLKHESLLSTNGYNPRKDKQNHCEYIAR
jgi:hypothetical protein